jgi:hypothetical protein
VGLPGGRVKVKRIALGGLSMEKAVCYIRGSVKKSGNWVSVAVQEKMLLNYCKLAGLVPVMIIQEVEEDAVAKPLTCRAGGEKLLRLVAGKQVKHIVVFMLDQLFSDTEDILILTKSWNKAGITLHLVDFQARTDE